MMSFNCSCRGLLAVAGRSVCAVLLSAAFALLLAAPVQAQEFIVTDIRVEGLQRISAGAVFAAMPINVGDLIDGDLIRQSVRALFATGNFDDIQIGRDGNVLVIIVVERPSISEITIEGNKALETDQLLDGLKQAGLAEGQVFQRSTLEGMQLEVQRQYVQQGRYDAAIEAEVIPEPRNRVAINIDVNEGNVAKIKHINVVGNHVYSDEELTDLFELKTSSFFSFITGDDKYSKEKLGGDLETLSSWYLDRGYLQFRISSTQVSVSPEKDAVYITANIHEGDVYTVSDVELSGDLVLEAADLRRFLIVRKGQIFSQQLVTGTEEYLVKRLGNEGYNFARVSGIPKLDEDTKTVAMKFFIDPGKRTYVRRISFHGNSSTVDEVLRREMRQMEGAPASASAIENSKIRLERLGFFQEVKVETPGVPGHDDLIDIEFEVEEQNSGSISATLGYAQGRGLVLGLNMQQDNFLGSGKRVGIGISSSKYQDLYSFSYTNPYYTEDGVSRGFSLFYRATDLDEINVARYSTDTFGVTTNFSYPIRETQRLGLSFGASDTKITVGDFAVAEIVSSPRPRLVEEVEHYYRGDDTTNPIPIGNDLDSQFAQVEPGFIDTNGNEYLNWTITGSWLQSTLNRGLLPTAGTANTLSLELSMPGSDLEFYKLNYRGDYYLPLGSWVLRFRGELGYGEGFGDTSELPFYEHFFAGGFGSVRGFESNTLGPRTTPATFYIVRNDPMAPMAPMGTPGYILESDGLATTSPRERSDPFGGNVLLEAGIELIFPLPFIKDQRRIRPAFFVDAGNVFSSHCRASQNPCSDVDFGEIRYSVGVGVTWYSGFGPLSFSLAKPFNAGDFDEEESFQFTLGQGF